VVKARLRPSNKRVNLTKSTPWQNRGVAFAGYAPCSTDHVESIVPREARFSGCDT
jgi:hypothetical protein